jgi:hypothetical protein
VTVTVITLKLTITLNVLSYGLSLFTGQAKKKVPFWSKIAESYAVCGTSGCARPLQTQNVGEENVFLQPETITVFGSIHRLSAAIKYCPI